jgi:Spy/CpxP family protein refolding chaperone
MVRKTCVLAVAVWAAAATIAVWAQPLVTPQGRWWDRPVVAAKLGLTDEQKQKLETTTIDHARTMVDLKAAVEKAELELRVAADTEPFDAAKVRQAFGRLQQARMRLETERFDLLLAQRELLSAEQWQKLRGLAREIMQRRRGAGGPEEQPGQWRPPQQRRY